MSKFINALIGSKQSKFAAIAFLLTIIVFCISIFLLDSKISIENRIISMFLILLLSIPGILLSLLELTCIVTGGSSNGDKPWWCWYLAWIISILIIVYCIIIIISIVNTVFTYKKANKNLQDYNNQNKTDIETANNIADSIMKKDISEKSEKKIVIDDDIKEKKILDSTIQMNEISDVVKPVNNNKLVQEKNFLEGHNDSHYSLLNNTDNNNLDMQYNILH